MTLQDFHIGFDIELDKTLDFEYAYIQPEQKDYWLNKAQDRIVKYKVFGNNPTRTSFEETQKRIDDLRTIVKDSSPIVPTSSGNISYITLPDDYKFLVRHRALINTKTVTGVQVSHDSIGVFLEDPFWEPIAEEPLYYFLGNTIVYETKGNFNITSTVLTYIKKYAKIQYGSQYTSPTTDINTELPEEVHQEILDLAISMVLENIESQRYQTNLNELNKSE